MRTWGALLLASLALAGPAVAVSPVEHAAECKAAAQQLDPEFPLPHVSRAIAAKQLRVLVVGAGSSSLPGPNGANNAYPARLQSALSAKLPGVTVKVTADVKSRRTAGDMVKTLEASLAATKPALLVWQTGTVDAMLSVDPDQFSTMLNRGINTAHSAGADVVLVNSQYSPRTESLIALSSYAENMRWVAVQQEVPLFDRFNVMKLWADIGTFDLLSAKDKLDIAQRVHDCIGRLLADFIFEAAGRNDALVGTGR
jgi:lysophospholipase L1-like esterase